jgi:hypothetical protein
VDPSRLERLVELEARQDGGKPAGQHGLPGAGGADEKDVVATGGGDFESPLGGGLTPDVGEVHGLDRAFVSQALEVHQRGR